MKHPVPNERVIKQHGDTRTCYCLGSWAFGPEEGLSRWLGVVLPGKLIYVFGNCLGKYSWKVGLGVWLNFLEEEFDRLLLVVVSLVYVQIK